MMSERVAARSVGMGQFFAGFELVHRAAVGALALAVFGQVDEHFGVGAPQGHFGVGAGHHAWALQVGGQQLNRGGGGVVHDQTVVSHSAYLGLRPLTMSKNAF